MQKKMQNLDVEPNKKISMNYELHQEETTEWPQNNAIDLYALASAAGRLVGNLNEKPGALDEFFNKLKILEHEWYEAEKRYHNLKIENDRLTNQLIHERTRCAIYQKKLKFIQDNQKNFEKLKQVYLTMKKEESVTKKTVDFREESCQTIDIFTPPVTVSVPLTTFTKTIPTCDKNVLTKYHGSIIQSDSMVSIRRSELNEAQDNLHLLKEMIKKREFTWSINIQRENAMQEEIRNLEQDKKTLEALVKVQDIELKTLRGMKSENPTQQQEAINNMKCLIGKMNRRLKELEKQNDNSEKFSAMLEDNEKEVIQILEKKTPIIKKPQMVKPQPAKITTNRSFPGSVTSKQTRTVKPNLSTIIESKPKPLSPLSDDSDGQELELLGHMKQRIEAKQAALKEKVQQIINYSEHKLDAK